MRNCIMCGNRSASREHVFPAALGGRRTNKGIYCADHNNAFSRHAHKIAEQLRHFNAFLAIRPDHAKVAKPYQYAAENGEHIVVFDGEVRRVNPQTVQGPGMINSHLELGGPEALRAVGYIALTFFAHHYPDEARMPEFGKFKAFIEQETSNEYVWWEGPETTEALPHNNFPFGHTILLMISAETGNVTALLSFFQGMTFGVRLGRIKPTRPHSTVIYLDPHADSPPNDIRVEKTDSCLFELEKPEPLQSHLERMVRDNVVMDGISNLFERINKWKFNTDTALLLQRLNDARHRPNVLRAEIEDVLSELTKYVFLMLNHLALKSNEHLKNTPEDKAIRQIIAQIATQDVSQEKGITPLSELSIVNAMGALAENLALNLKTGELDIEYLWRLFRTGYGIAVIGPSVLAPIFATLYLSLSKK